MIGDPGEPAWDGRMFCGACGCPKTAPSRCACGAVEYSLNPNPQHDGWLRRQQAKETEPVATKTAKKTAPAHAAAAEGYQLVPLGLIQPSPTNPRRHFDPVKLAELTESIRSKGVLQPILVRLPRPAAHRPRRGLPLECGQVGRGRR